MTDPLIIPARDWVGSVPAGCPVTSHGHASTVHGGPEMVADEPRLYEWEGINLSPPPLDADGYPTRMDALPVVAARWEAVARTTGTRFAVDHRDDPRLAFGFDLLSRLPSDEALRRLYVALFIYRGPGGERAWEVAP